MRNKFSTYLFLVFCIVLLLENSCKKDDETPKVVKTHFNPELTYDTVSDFDKNIYKTIAIGQQIWLAENLKTTHYSDGTPIPYCASSSDWSGLTTGGYCWNENDIKNKAIYGGIYNFYAVIDRRNVCPSGWHVPNYNDWYILQQGLGGDEFVGGHLKEIEFDHWEKPNTGADNSSGFTALPASGRSANGDFGVSGYGTGLWTSTEVNLPNAWWSDLGYNKSYLGANSGLKTQGLSIRCIKDQYHISITSITNILHKSAMIYGFVYSDYPAALLESGICWSTEPEPTVNDNLIKNLSGIGYFSCFMKNLTPGSKYFVKAYAIFSKDTIYGDETYFETPANSLSSIKTIAINNITANTAKCVVNIRDDGGLAISAKGVCWSTSQNPTVDLPTKTNNGVGIGEFTSSIIGLTENTEYFFRAYATNSQGTAYGNEIKIKTPIAALPTVTTAIATNIKAISATSGGNVIFDGNLPVTARGVCWSTSQNPTVDLPTKTVDGTGRGLFTSNISDLLENTVYYIRAYATNSLGTTYGNEVTFTTLGQTKPTLQWSTISNVSFTSASCESQVYSDGNSSVTERGFCWSTSSNPTIENGNKTTIGAGLGIFSCTIAGLAEGTKYYVKPYAINSKGVAYGYEDSFTTLKHSTPILSNYLSFIGALSADCDVNIYNDGFYPVTERGICWSTSPNPSVESGNKIVSSSTSSYFKCIITGLSEDTKYFVRGYAINSMGIGYGQEVSFSTFKITTPIFSAISLQNISYSSAEINILLTNDGYSSITESGICWSKNPNPTIENSYKIIGETKFDWVKYKISGLEPNTTYYAKGYAINGKGVGYSVESSFKMLALTVPKLTTFNASYVTSTSLTIGGSITDDGGASIIDRGICWSTSPNPTIELNDKMSFGTGNGTFNGNVTGLTENTKYYFRSYATNSMGISYGNEVAVLIYFGNVTDIDGNVYNTLAIGTQVWMKENLKTTKYNNGEPIANIVSNDVWEVQTNGAYCWQNNDIKNKDKHGALYNWYAVVDSRNLCPTGWHVPTGTEWSTLRDYLGGYTVAGGKMKATTLWNSPNTGADNSSGFNAFASGYRFTAFGFESKFWASSTLNYQSTFILYWNDSSFYSGYKYQGDGLSVRCLKNE